MSYTYRNPFDAGDVTTHHGHDSTIEQCDWCGEEFDADLHPVQPGYCSLECAVAATREGVPR